MRCDTFPLYILRQMDVYLLIYIYKYIELGINGVAASPLKCTILLYSELYLTRSGGHVTHLQRPAIL